MEDNVFKILFGLFTEFTWRRFFALVSVVFVFFILFSLYERYTSSFRLGRLQKSAELIAKIQEIEIGITNSSPAVRQDYEALVAQASEAIRDKPLSLDFIPNTLRLRVDAISKFFAGGALWFLFAFIALVTPRSGNDTTAFRGFSSLIAFGVVTGLIGIFIPDFCWPWFHIFIYPLVVMFLMLMAIIPLVYFSRKIAANNPTNHSR
jgi:hypothetical protein